MWLIELQNGGRGYSSIHNIRGVVKPAFQMAVDDDLLLKKSLQYLMGHSEVATTMDVYTHFGYEEAKVEVGKVSGAI